MILKFFKQTLPQVIVIFVLLTILLWLRSFYNSDVFPFYFDSIKMPFYSLITNWLTNNIFYSRIFTFGVMLFTGFYLLQINSKHIIIKQRTYLPAFFYLILISSIRPLHQINPSVFAAFFIVFTLDHILSIYHKEDVLDNLFKAGFYIAIASLFYAPAILYFIAVLLSIISIRSFNLRECCVAILGFFTPWFFYFFYHYFFSNDLLAIFRILNLNLFTEVNNDNNGVLLYVCAIYLLILFMITGVFLVKTLPIQKISVRKFHGAFFWFNLTSIAIIFLIPSVSLEIVYIAIIPITFQFAHYFTTSNRKFWPEFFFISLIAISILMQFHSN
jgi:hypothetical protein